MLKLNKKGFTLAETIMTLFIVGLVVAAAIPVFTMKKTNAPVASDIPWRTCDAIHGGLCTNSKVAIPIDALGTDQYSLSVQSKYFDDNAYVNSDNYSPYDAFHSDRRSFIIKDLFFSEGDYNFVITRNPVRFLRRNNVSNFILDTGDLQFNLDSLDNSGGTRHNVSIGHSNRLCNGCRNPIPTDGRQAIDPSNFSCESNVILGNNNILGKTAGDNAASAINNSIIFGQDNVIDNYVNSSVVIGQGNVASDNNCSPILGFPGPSILVGFGLQDNNTAITGTVGAAADSYFSIGDHIYGTRGEIIFNGNLTLSSSSSLTVYVPRTTSDERLKNIKGLYSKGLKEILQVQPVVFAYKSDPAANENVGVIAQDIQKVFPEAVVPMPSGFLGVDTDPMFFAMINSLKEINAETQTEMDRQQALKDELAQLKSELAELNACRANGFVGKIECFIADIKRFFKSLAWFAEGEADEKA